MRLSTLRLAIPLACAALTGCDLHGRGIDIVPEFDDTFSFETGMEEWYARGIDLGDPPVTWEVARSNERADAGAYSVAFQLANLNDQGKIWIERRYEVAPDQEYEVTLTFALATADYGTINLWRLLAGVSPDQPTAGSQLIATQDTGNGSATDVGFQWVEKTIVLRTRSDADG